MFWVWLIIVAALAGSAHAQPQTFDRAVADLLTGRYEAAEHGFLEILKSSPEHVASLENLGLVYARTNRLDQAVKTYRRALDLSPGNTTVLLNLGLAYMKLRSYRQALDTFQVLVKADPANRMARDTRLLFPLASGYLKEADTQEDRRKLSAFLSTVSPPAASLVICKLYLERDRMDEAAGQCRKTLSLDPAFPEAHLEMARVLVGQGDADAGRELDAAIREGSDDPEALYDLGVALIAADRTAEGVRYLERVRQVNPEFWGSYYNLGKVKLRANQPEQAVPLLQRAAELKPDSFSVFYELGRALTAAGRTEEAQRAMARVRELLALEVENERKAPKQ
jgi:tetratricopeptide (TPR) repeat protein